jgi:hypothetical protein
MENGHSWDGIPAQRKMKILGRVSVRFQKRVIKGVVNFKEGKVFEVLGHAFNRQGFFVKGFVPDFMAPAGYPFLISPF